MISLPLPAPSTSLWQARFHLLSLMAGLSIAMTGVIAIESAEPQSHAESRHRVETAAPNAITMPKSPLTIYYIITSAPSSAVPEEAVDVELGGVPSNISLHFRVIDSPESEAQLQDELDWHRRDQRRYEIFDMR